MFFRIIICMFLMLGIAKADGIYLSTTTAELGEEVRAYISTPSPTTDLFIIDKRSGQEIYRVTVDGSTQPDPPNAWLGVNWPRYEVLPVLPAGAYAVRISEPMPQIAWGQYTNRIGLLVRPIVPQADVLVVLDSPTSLAYNEYGGRSLYSDPRTTEFNRNRPGYSKNFIDAVVKVTQALDMDSISWELADTDYIEEHPSLLPNYKLIVITEQMEYVSRPYREQLEAYYDGGGRIAILGNEIFYAQTRREPQGTVCYRTPYRGPDPITLDGDPSNDYLATYEWFRVLPTETSTFGISINFGGKPTGDLAWTVHRQDHWLWENTGLTEGALFGVLGVNTLIDGTIVTFDGQGLPFIDNVTETKTPTDFLVLATIPIFGARYPSCYFEQSPPDITVCDHPGWGVVGVRQNDSDGALIVIPDKRWFTTGWATSPVVQITRNIMTKMSSSAPIDMYDGYEPLPEPAGGLVVGIVGLWFLYRRNLKRG